MTSQTAIGIGYEGRDIDSFVSLLQLRSVELVVDVRLNPMSRKAGFSKRALAARLDAEGISYRHEPALGNPRNNREGYGLDSGDAAARARSTFLGRLGTDEARAALARLTEDTWSARVAILCFESDEDQCHRRQILDALRESRQSSSKASRRSGSRGVIIEVAEGII